MALTFYSDGMTDEIRLALDRWWLKDRCRRITVSAAAISHNQCQYWWKSMKFGWRLTLFHGRKKESQSQFTGCVNNKKIPYLKAGWLWARSFGQLCNKEYIWYYHWWMVGTALIYLSLFIVCFTHISNYKKRIGKQINPRLSYIVGL